MLIRTGTAPAPDATSDRKKDATSPLGVHAVLGALTCGCGTAAPAIVYICLHHSASITAKLRTQLTACPIALPQVRLGAMERRPKRTILVRR